MKLGNMGNMPLRLQVKQTLALLLRRLIFLGWPWSWQLVHGEDSCAQTDVCKPDCPSNTSENQGYLLQNVSNIYAGELSTFKNTYLRIYNA